MSLRYAVIGTGAIGGYYGACLAHSGAEVHFLARSDADHIRQHGLVLDSVNGRIHLEKVACHSSTATMPKCDVVCVALKTTNNAIIAELVRPILAEHGVVILLQNGLGMEEDVAAALPAISIAAGVASICAFKQGPGHIQHQAGGQLILAEATTVLRGRLDSIAETFSQAGIPAKVARNLLKARWSKLIWNIPFNGLSVMLGVDTSVLTAPGPARELVADLMQEVMQALKPAAQNYHQHCQKPYSMPPNRCPRIGRACGMIGKIIVR